MKIKAIYDNQGTTFDRYTVYYDNEGVKLNTWFYIGMSEHPTHPQGFGQHGEGMIGKHNGKKITFKELPKDCQELISYELKEA